MKNVLICFVVLTGLLLSPVAVFSMEDEVIENIEKASMELSGQVLSIDIENQQVVIEYQIDDQETATSAVFYLSDTTEIYSNGEVISVAELKEGDTVVVMYQTDDNGNEIILEITLINQ